MHSDNNFSNQDKCRIIDYMKTKISIKTAKFIFKIHSNTGDKESQVGSYFQKIQMKNICFIFM